MKYFLVIIWLIASFGTHLAKRLHVSFFTENLCEFFCTAFFVHLCYF
jgi:hypothetical protein